MSEKYSDPEKLRGYLKWRLSLTDEEFHQYFQGKKQEWEGEIKKLLHPASHEAIPVEKTELLRPKVKKLFLVKEWLMALLSGVFKPGVRDVQMDVVGELAWSELSAARLTFAATDKEKAPLPIRRKDKNLRRWGYKPDYEILVFPTERRIEFNFSPLEEPTKQPPKKLQAKVYRGEELLMSQKTDDMIPTMIFCDDVVLNEISGSLKYELSPTTEENSPENI